MNISDISSLIMNRQLSKTSREELIMMESKIGKNLFGEIPTGRSREFYCLDAHTWVWQEEFKGSSEKQIVRYEVRPDSIIKNVNGTYKEVTGAELKNLRTAMRVYYEQVMRNIYKTDPFTGRKLA